MAFCGNCGRELREGEVCNCTTASQTTAQPTVQPTVQAPVQPPVQSPEKKKVNVALIVFICFLVVILVLAIVAVALLVKPDSSEKDKKKDKDSESKKVTYMEPVEDFLEEFNNKNTNYTEVLATLMPDDAAELYLEVNRLFQKSDSYMDEYEDDVDYTEDYYDEIEDEYEKWELSFKKSNATKLSDTEIKEIQSDLSDYYEDEIEDWIYDIEDVLDGYVEEVADSFEMEPKDFEATMEKWLEYLEFYENVSVNGAYRVTGKFILKDKDGKYESNEVTFLIAKIGKSWTFLGNEGESIVIEGDSYEVFDILNDYLDNNRFYVEIEF